MLERPPQSFDENIVLRSTPAVHADFDIAFLQCNLAFQRARFCDPLQKSC